MMYVLGTAALSKSVAEDKPGRQALEDVQLIKRRTQICALSTRLTFRAYDEGLFNNAANTMFALWQQIKNYVMFRLLSQPFEIRCMI
jgi:hypothetical protein